MPRLPNGAKAPAKKKKPAPPRKATTRTTGGKGYKGTTKPTISTRSVKRAAGRAVKSYEGAVSKYAPDGSKYKDGKLKNPGAQRVVKGGKGKSDKVKVVASPKGRGGAGPRGGAGGTARAAAAKPKPAAKKKPAKPKTAAQEFRAMKIKEDKAYKAKQAAAKKKAMWDGASKSKASPKKKVSDWDKGMNWMKDKGISKLK